MTRFVRTSSEAETPREFQHGKILVISPHADDAAYSIGGLLQKSILKSRVHLLTLFGRSNFTRKTGFAEDWEEISRLRKREDMAFAQRIGAEITFFDLPEASIRIGASEAIFDDAGSPGRAAVPQKLSVLAKRLLDRLRPVAVFAPLGIGGHRDHLISRQLAAREARIRKLPIFYYEDLPYSAYQSNRALIEYTKSLNSKLRPLIIPIDLARKLNGLTLYRSQVAATELQIVADYAGRGQGEPRECVWSASPDQFLRIVQQSRVGSPDVV